MRHRTVCWVGICLWFGISISIVLCLFLLLGCATSLMSHEPVTRSVMLTTTPDVAYRRAIIAIARMGGEITQENTSHRWLQATVRSAVRLHVEVLAVPAGAEVQVTGSLIPGKVVMGSLTEVESYAALVEGQTP